MYRSVKVQAVNTNYKSEEKNGETSVRGYFDANNQ